MSTSKLSEAGLARRAALAMTGCTAFVGVAQAAVGKVAATDQTKLRESVSVKDFGAVGNGLIDDTLAIQKALNAAKNGTIKKVHFPSGIYLVSSGFYLDVSFSNIALFGDGHGASIIKKAFNGTLFSLATVVDFEAQYLQFEGSYTNSHTGICFDITGNTNFLNIANCYFTGFSTTAIQFGANSGFNAQVTNCQFFYAKSELNVINIVGPDATAMFRKFNNIAANGNITLNGALDTHIVGSHVTRVVIHRTSSITEVVGTIWAAGATPIVLDGTNTIVVGCRLAQSVTLNSTMTGVFAANIQTNGTITDNSVGGNVLRHYHPLSATYEVLSHHKYSASMTASEFHLNQITSLSDEDSTWYPDKTATTIRLAANLTANRTITLTTAGTRAGVLVRISRPGGDTGGPWALTVGTTGKVLGAKSWCDAMYNGSYWEVVAYGTLP